MTRIRIWTLESDYSAKAVKSLAHQLLETHPQDSDLSIWVSDKRALPKRGRKRTPLNEALKSAILHFLKQDSYVIFFKQASSRHLQKETSLFKQIEQLAQEPCFKGKVSLAQTLHELKTGLTMAHRPPETETWTWHEEWDRVVSHFHDAFADTPQAEVERDLEEALAEVRRERA